MLRSLGILYPCSTLYVLLFLRFHLQGINPKSVIHAVCSRNQKHVSQVSTANSAHPNGNLFLLELASPNKMKGIPESYLSSLLLLPMLLTQKYLHLCSLLS